MLLHADELLRAGPWATQTGRPGRILAQLVAFIACFGLLYGAVMGCFGGIRGERILQVLYSALKVPILLLCTFAISLPSFFILNTLAGLRGDFLQALRALAAAQAALTIVLASLAPFTALWYASSADYRTAILFNALMFGLASIAAQLPLAGLYRPLVQRDPRHRWLLRSWLVLYAFVGIQMGWVLRPFVGNPGAPTRFFRAGAWGNAYVEVVTLIQSALGY